MWMYYDVFQNIEGFPFLQIKCVNCSKSLKMRNMNKTRNSVILAQIIRIHVI